MRAIAVLMKYDYGVEERGYSYEYLNVYLPLCSLLGSPNVLLFDFMAEIKKRGRSGMNARLKEVFESEKPDFGVFCLFENEFDESIVDSLKNVCKTVVYFFDDPWRTVYAKKWISHFDFFTTSDFYKLKQYELEGLRSVIYTPFGFNSLIYKKLDLQKKYEISFVGGYSSYRGWIMSILKKHGLTVNVFGRGWGSKQSWISQEQMVEIFNQSRINLNLSNNIHADFRYLIWSLKSFRALKEILQSKKYKEMIKGRHYEINACGGFQLSYFVPGLNLIYEIEKEIAVYENISALPEAIEFYLRNDELRESIALKGYERSVKEHDAQNYIKRIIDRVKE